MHIFEAYSVPEIPSAFSTISTFCAVFLLLFFSLTTSVKIKSQCIVLFYGSNPSRLISAMTCRSADVHTLVEKVKNHLNIVQYFVCSFLIASRVKLYGVFLNTKISFMPEI